MPRRSRGYGQGQARRLTSWLVGPGSSVVTAFSSSSTSILGSGALATVDGLTVVRLRGSILAVLNSATAAGDGFHCALGVGVCTADAFAVGVTALPAPIDEVDWDGWMYHRFFDVNVGDKTAGDVNWNSATFREEVDSKAMRKLPENMVLFASLQAVEDTTASMLVYFDSRVLVKLP